MNFITIKTRQGPEAFVRPDHIVAILCAPKRERDLAQDDHRTFFDVWLSCGEKIVITKQELPILMNKLDAMALEPERNTAEEAA